MTFHLLYVTRCLDNFINIIMSKIYQPALTYPIEFPNRINYEQWLKDNQPQPGMMWNEARLGQINDIRVLLEETLAAVNPIISVVSTHKSKSIVLPVYLIEIQSQQFILRNNFYNWTLSVIRKSDIHYRLRDIIKRDEVISSCYCEGFDSQWTFGSYNMDESQFTCQVDTFNTLNILMYLLVLA